MMASQNWKNYHHAPIQDSAILAYQPVESLSPGTIPTSNGMREAGIIEKLLHSYGFIQCCERQDRLFFHYSQFQGNIEGISHGDPVEFEMTYDRRTGKPVATNVIKMDAELISNSDIISEERVTGTITTEIEDDSCQGRISYENRGECFFLLYTKSDLIDSGARLTARDNVTFQIATDRTGNLHARNIKSCKPSVMETYQGVVCTLKDAFGFIERSDAVKEIFFHFSECKNVKDLKLGDDVQFGIQTRHFKEVAVNIELLPSGTVIFEDVLPEVLRGQISKPIDRSQSPKHQSDPFPGKLKCVIDNVETILSFGDRDIMSDFTLFADDWIEFNVAVDRRDNMRRATNMKFLMKESFRISEEKREKGIIFTVKDGFGFIKCANREQHRLFFHFNEIIDSQTEIRVQDEVEFFVTQDIGIPNRQNAIRIRRLPRGSVTFNHANNKNAAYSGVIESEPSGQWFRNKVSNKEEETNQENQAGFITYHENNAQQRIRYILKDCVDHKNLPKTDDKVEFNIIQNGNGAPHAIDIKLMTNKRNGMKNGCSYTSQGFIAALRDNFGFIESEDHSREIFFHYSVFDGDSNKLELGREVEYALSQKCIGNTSGKLSAEAVRKLANGTIPTEEAKGEVLTGTIMRPIRCFNPDQEEYAGLIQIKSEENEEPKIYNFGITSLVDKKVFVQNGDVCEFQLGCLKDGVERAVNIKAVRDRIKATVEAIKGQYGFLSHEIEEGKKLFFHKSEVKDNSMLKSGDVVDFVIIKNHRNGRFSACDVKLISEAATSQPRPEHLTRLRNMSLSQDDSSPRIITIRQPLRPDVDKNFKNHPMLSSTTEEE